VDLQEALVAAPALFGLELSVVELSAMALVFFAMAL
jgi:hypothetical protein